VSVGPEGISIVSAPVKGAIEHCELKSIIGDYYDCSPEMGAVRQECTSNNSQLTLTRAMPALPSPAVQVGPRSLPI